MKRRIARIEFVIGAALLSTIVFLVFIASTMRFLGYPIIWSVDLAQLLFIWLCFVGATRAMRQRGHLGVDLVVRRFPYRVRLVIEILMAVLFITFMVVLAVEGYKLSILNRERIFGDSGLSYFYVTIAVPVGCLYLSAAIIANAVEAWFQRSGGKLLIFSRLKSDQDPAP